MTPDKIVAIYGTGGYGRQLMDLLRDCVEKLNQSKPTFLFVDDKIHRDSVNGCKVVEFNDLKRYPSSNVNMFLGVADPIGRYNLFKRIQKSGFNFPSLFAHNSKIGSNVIHGEGCILSYFSLITCNVKIGKFFAGNHYTQISHDCKIGDFVTLAPGARCNGNVVVEDFAYIGSNAVIKQGLNSKPLIIGRNSIIGMGSVVTKSVAAGQTVIGNPARCM